MFDERDFMSPDPLVRFNAHQAAKGNPQLPDPDVVRKAARENPVSAMGEARSLLEECWETICGTPQPDDEKAVAENRLLERIEKFLLERHVL